MKIAILFAGTLFATQALSADLELSDRLLDTVSAGNASCCYELLDSADPNDLRSTAVTLPGFPSFIKVRTPRDPAPTENLAVSVSRPALELLQRDSSAWQGSLEDPITVERLAQPQRSSTFALQQLLSNR